MPDDWLVNESIDVDVRQLQDFSKHIQDELTKNFSPSFSNGIEPMLRVQAPFGGPGMKEGAFFRVQHSNATGAAALMLRDAMANLAALSKASMAIAAEYMTGDALAQATNDDVYKAFIAADKPPAVAGEGDQAGSGNAAADAAAKDAEQNPAKYQGGDTGGSSFYDGEVIQEGKPGEYHVLPDVEDLHNPSLDSNTDKH